MLDRVVAMKASKVCGSAEHFSTLFDPLNTVARRGVNVVK